MTIGVCKDCQERHPACWGTCEKYMTARKELEARKAEKMSKFHMDCAMNSVQYNGLRMYRRRKSK